MRTLLLSCLLFLSLQKVSSQEYYYFPSHGWKQTLLLVEHNGYGWDESVHEFYYTHDSVINSQTYQVIQRGPSSFFTREEDGRIYWLIDSDERLLYDFSLLVGDTLENFYFNTTGLHTVIKKEKIHHASGDSLWYLEIKINNFNPDTVYWLEGVGDLRSGLLPFIFPDAGYSHICSRNSRNQTIYASPEHPVDCNCDYLHGQDNDEDGYRNHIPMWKYFYIAESDWPPPFAKSGKHRRCDTLVIINDTGYSIEVEDGTTGAYIDPDSIAGMWEELYYYSMGGINDIIISHQQANEYYHISILECETHDCNDQDSTIHAFHIEVPYDGLDNDCNPTTPDDDIDMDGYPLGIDCEDDNPLVNIDQIEIVYNGHDDDCDTSTLDDDFDQDGYNLAEDCDDDNSSISPGLIEVPYNLIDDDCNSKTPDDDIDMDGFLNEEDCNDNNTNINPGVIEIPDNGIDEDCDGNDLTTPTIELAGIKITIYPNPVSQNLFIKCDQSDLTIHLLDLTGQIIHRQRGILPIDVTGYAPGMYFLEICRDSEGLRVLERIVIVK